MNVATMANTYYKAWSIGQTSSSGSFSAISGTGSSMADLNNIVSQANSFKANRIGIKSYYNELAKSENFNVKDFLNSSKDSSQVSEKILDDTSALKDAAKALSATGDASVFKVGEDGTYDMEKIAEAVNSFVSNYNSVTSSVADSGNMSILQKGAVMLNQSATNYNALSKVGITVETSGKLKLDSEKLKNSDVNDLKALFEGSGSYADRISATAQNINHAAQASQYKTYNNYGAASFSLASTLGNFVNYSA